MKVKSSRGREVDMGLLMQQNPNAIAMGNARMNARGDIIGKGGQVEQTRETTTSDYYAKNPNSVKEVKKVSIRDLASETPFVTPTEAVEQIMKKNSTPKRKIEDKD